MPTSFNFSTEQISEISRLNSEALARGSSASGAFAPVYQYVAEQVIRAAVPASQSLWQDWPNLTITQWSQAMDFVHARYGQQARQSVIWLIGASGVNRGDGVFSKMIREYNQRQCDLRGVTCNDALLQIASNKVGEYFVKQILDERKLQYLADGTVADVHLDSKRSVALVEVAQAPTNGSYWSDLGANLANLAAKASSITEGTGKSFTVYLNMAAKAGEALLLLRRTNEC